MSKESVQELRDMFNYHPDGYLVRKSTGRPCGQRPNRPDGRIHVQVGRRKLLAHRIVYAIVTGEMPNGDIDHIDGNPLNNRIENLRDVSKSENLHNSKNRKDNSSGFPGVHWHHQHQKWHARIQVDNQRIFLGYFSDYEDAVRARKIAKIKHHPTSPEAQKFASELFRVDVDA